MNELIAQITQRTGLSPDQARQAAEAVIGFLKSRLPAPIAAHVDQIVGLGAPGATGTAGTTGGAGASAEGLGGIAKELGGLFGR